REEVQQRLNGTHMFVVLPERILKAVFDPIEHLGPVAIPGVGEDPPAIVFGLDDKDPEPRDQDVIDLRGVTVDAQREVIEEVIVRGRKSLGQFARYPGLPTVLSRPARSTAAIASQKKADREGDARRQHGGEYR